MAKTADKCGGTVYIGHPANSRACTGDDRGGAAHVYINAQTFFLIQKGCS
jgi:hypothetical protein